MTEKYTGPHILRPNLNELYPIEPLPADLENTARRIDRRLRWSIIDKIGNAIFYTILTVFVVFCISQVADRTPPTTIDMQLLTPVVELGGQISIKVSILRMKSCEWKTRWIIRDGINRVHYFGPTASDSFMPIFGSPGQDKPFIRDFPVPRDLAPGDASLRLTREYICPGNYFQRYVSPIVVVYPDIDFKITQRLGHD